MSEQFVKYLCEVPRNYEGIRQLFDEGIYPCLITNDIVSYSFYFYSKILLKDIELIQIFLDYGLDINRTYTGEKYTMLSISIYLAEIPTITFLISKGAVMNNSCRRLFIQSPKRNNRRKMFLLLFRAFGNFLNDTNLLSQEEKKEYQNIMNAPKKWTTVKCTIIMLSLQKRAVERVNHPDRLFQQGFFDLN